MLQWQSLNSVPLGSVAAHTLIIGFFPSAISSSCGENIFFLDVARDACHFEKHNLISTAIGPAAGVEGCNSHLLFTYIKDSNSRGSGSYEASVWTALLHMSLAASAPYARVFASGCTLSVWLLPVHRDSRAH